MFPVLHNQVLSASLSTNGAVSAERSLVSLQGSRRRMQLSVLLSFLAPFTNPHFSFLTFVLFRSSIPPLVLLFLFLLFSSFFFSNFFWLCFLLHVAICSLLRTLPFAPGGILRLRASGSSLVPTSTRLRWCCARRSQSQRSLPCRSTGSACSMRPPSTLFTKSDSRLKPFC